MNRYFLIPVTSRSVQMGGISFFTMLKQMDSDLYRRELDRIEITYELPKKAPVSNKAIEIFNQKTSELYQQRSIPQFLVIVQNEEGIKELVTHKDVTFVNSSYLEAFERKPEDVLELFDQYPYYSQNVADFVDIGMVPEKEKQKYLQENN